MKINEILEKTIIKLKEKNIEDATTKARRLLAFVLNEKKEYLITHNDCDLQTEQQKQFEQYINEIINGKPIQYILGYQEFMEINFFVNENVLIPQPDTEILVEKTIEIATKINQPQILDLCTGSGAIAISLSKNLQDAIITASDISIDAINIAKHNDTENKIQFIKSNLFENINEKFDILVSNPPYIKTEEIKTLSKEVQNEPFIALDGGEDGLYFYKEIIKNAHNYLKKNGYLCLEIGDDQRQDVIKLINKVKYYNEIKTYKDLAGNDRVIICKKINN